MRAMTYQQIYTVLERTGLPVAFNFWEIGQVPPLPYIVFTYPGSNDMAADNINYVEIVELDVELCMKRKSIPTERAVEAILTQYFGTFGKISAWLPDDDMQLTTYTLEVLING